MKQEELDRIVLAALNLIIDTAEEYADGHLTILRFPTQWRVGFVTPESREEIESLAAGETFMDAATIAVTRFMAEVRGRAKAVP